MGKNMILYSSYETVEEKYKSWIERFNKNLSGIFEPVKYALIFYSGTLNSIFITNKYIGIQLEGIFGGVKIIKKDFSDFEDFKFKFINLYAYFKGKEKIKLGLADSYSKEDTAAVEKFKEYIKNESTGKDDDTITFRINKEILKFDEDNSCIEYKDNKIDFKNIRDVRLIVKDDKTVHSANLGGALMGYFLVGGLGALIGSSTGDKTKVVISTVTISVLTNDLRNPNLDIIISDKIIDSDSLEYKEIDEISRKIFNMFEIIVSRNK